MGRWPGRASESAAQRSHPGGSHVDPVQTFLIAIAALVTTNLAALSLERDRRRQRRRPGV